MPVLPVRRRGAAVAMSTAWVSFLSLTGLFLAPAAQAAVPGANARAGEINIIATHSGRCVAVENSSSSPGAPVEQADCTGQAGAVWTLQESPAGVNAVMVVNAHSGRCLEAPSGAVGEPVRQADCTGRPGASFRVVDKITHAWLQPVVANPSTCLGITAGSHIPGAPVRVADCSGQPGIAFHQRAPRTGNDPAGEEHGGVKRVNVDSAGAQTPGLGGRFADAAAISANGRHVAFESTADNLVPGDTNNASDVFVRDQATGATERVSVSGAGAQGHRTSGAPAISADGRHVVFRSSADALVPGDTNNADDVFLRDRQTGATELISRSAAGERGSGASFSPSISADGRFVVFSSSADNLVPGDANGRDDVFLRDRRDGVIEIVSRPAGAAPSNGHSLHPVVTPDGRFVAFESAADNLAPGDANEVYDVFVRDRQTGATDIASVSTTGVQGGAGSFSPSISADGRFVAFESNASQLLPPGSDEDGDFDTLVRDRWSGVTEKISVTAGPENGRSSFGASISADGRHVAFTSEADTLVPYDTNNADDVFVRDRQTRTTVRAGVDADGVQGDGHSDHAVISANGQYVIFRSAAGNLVAGDTNNAQDLFARPRPAA